MMRVLHKALTIGSTSVLVLILSTYLIFYFTYYGYISKQQEHEIRRGFQAVDYIIENEKENMRSTIKDWAYWDDTYQFVKDLNSDYKESNLTDNTLETLDLRMMSFLDSRGNMIYSKGSNIENNIEEDLKSLMDSLDAKGSKEGLYLVAGRVFMIAVSDITDSNREQESNGYLVFVREVNQSMLNYIKNVANVNLRFSGHNDNIDELDYIRTQNNKDQFIANRVMKDIKGDASIVFTITKEQVDSTTIIYFFKRFVTLFLLFLGAILCCAGFSAYKFVLSRLTRLTGFLDAIAATKDTTLHIDLPGSDEFSGMADSTNRMLAELNSAYADMKAMDNRYRLIMEATNDGYLDFYAKTQEIYISPEWREIIGYAGENGHELFKDFLSKIHPESIEELKNKYKEVVNGDVEYFTAEYRVVKNSGEMMWVQQRGKVYERDENGKTIRVISTLANITDRKKHEEEILFLSYSDKLTGLRNRAYMEKQFEELDKNKDIRYFIIMGDLNGLKLVNDSMGHKEGDRLLCAISSIIKEVSSADDIVSRWGGDEFVILIKEKNQDYVYELIDKIKEACEKVSGFFFDISIALGYAEKDKTSADSELVMSLAEKRMYRNKLMENNSSRSSTISSLLKTLHEKHSETEEHTLRIKNLGLKLGKMLGLTQDKLDELELLALLHDIGKIGIPEQILMKPSSLTKDEWDTMKTHSEIGYRIAKSTPELSHIAREILTHHERYDGTGYPKGLKGEEIPILSRIINVIDSFDVMTHKRVYKEELSYEYAVEELIRCSGSQFDPLIVEQFVCLLKEEYKEKTA